MKQTMSHLPCSRSRGLSCLTQADQLHFVNTLKTGRLAISWLLIILFVIASILPAMQPEPVLAEPGVLQWNRMDTPGSVLDKNDIVSPSEVNCIAIGSDGQTFYAVDIPNANNASGAKALYKSTDGGISWSDRTSGYLYQAMTPAEKANFRIWNVAIAPGDVNFVAVVTNNGVSTLPRNVWVSTDGGKQWQNANCPAISNINTIDISSKYSTRDIAIGTRTGAGTGAIWLLKYPNYGNWAAQGLSADIMSLKFSPGYSHDATIAVVYSNALGTYVNAGIRDLNNNSTNWSAVYSSTPPEVTTGSRGSSAKADQIISADLELPHDFSGQAPSSRRYYVSIDAPITDAGIYRFDNATPYWLMPATATKRIASIAYHGTYASGKLLAGEVLGNPCTAQVMTWFTDAPTTCPITCWYPSLKAPTGAAGTDNCTGSGYGNARLAWSPDGKAAYVATASSAPLVAGPNWPNPFLTGENLDESAFSISRNNGQTWNQLALIDTSISQFIDIAPAPDCSTMYLASINNNLACSGFDSIWRSQSSPLCSAWERVLCATTTDHLCAANQTNIAILRLPGNEAEGQTVFWSAVGTRKLLWSPDFGEFWSSINTRMAIQDLAAEDSNTLYALSPAGSVQKFIRSGGNWTSGLSLATGLDSGYSIATAYTGNTPDNDKGRIIVASTGTTGYDVVYSTDGGSTFTPITEVLPTRGNTRVIASSSFNSDGTIMAINSGGMYAWSIYTGEQDGWETWWGGPSWPDAVTNLAISRNYSYYFSTPPGWPGASASPWVRWCLALSGLDPNISVGAATQPSTRLRICGGLESGDPITVWMIDQRPYAPPQGQIWSYTDTLCWLGPDPTEPVSLAAVDFDPVSGRNGQINIRWQPRSLSRGYQIQIAKDGDFMLRIADIGGNWGGPFYTPPSLDNPSLIIPPGSTVVTDANANTWNITTLEAGHTYYWKIRVRDVCTGDNINSPWSWRGSFTVKVGLPVRSDYYGAKLLSPENGCQGCPVSPASFSWSPYKNTKSYKFVLSKNRDMTEIITEAETQTTGFEYKGKLAYGTNYFWRVMALQPEPSDWSAIFSFQTEGAPAPSPVPPTAQGTPLWGWAIIAIGTITDIMLLSLVLRRM